MTDAIIVVLAILVPILFATAAALGIMRYITHRRLMRAIECVQRGEKAA